jgi:Flp pilus assembly secretin CpaC
MPAHMPGRAGITFVASRLGTAVAAGLTCLAALTADIAPAAASDLVVRYDQSTLIRLPRAVADIIVGNPSIADVTVQSGNMLVVTGKSFGVTNIITLDGDRNIIQDQRIVVVRDEAKVLNLMRGSARSSYNCAPYCNQVLTIGDDPAQFDALSKSTDRKLKMGENAAESAGQGSQ